jgi:gliding motility-associated-like protein
MMKIFLSLLFLLVTYFSIGQVDINMPLGDNGGNGYQFVGCNAVAFSDSQGNLNYGNSENNVTVLCPIISTDRMQLDFLYVDLLVNDVLTIYDGESIASPVIGIITNTSSAAGLFRASAGNFSGCLTVSFVSNSSGTAGGWNALRSCFNPCQEIFTDITTSPPIDADGILRICQGDLVTFDGQATFGAGATYEWDLANGAGFNLGLVQTETYVTTGIYNIKLRGSAIIGCSDRDEIDLMVQVSSSPDFTRTIATDTQLCFGETTTLTGVVAAQEFLIPVSPPVTGQTFLPDGNGTSYTTCIEVDLFNLGTTFNNASDLENVFLDIEHSFVGDLNIRLISPNGSSVAFLNFPNSGGNSFLGDAVDDDSTTSGVGFVYTFTEATTASQTLNQAAAETGADVPVPAGYFIPEDSFSNFIGSPLNGQWCIEVIDNQPIDNGYIFEWGLNFNTAIIPEDLSFTPVIVNEAWQASSDIISTVGNTIAIAPSEVGLNCYVYEIIDNHGCTYTTQVCVNMAPAILSVVPNDVVICESLGSAATVDLTINDLVVLNGLDASSHKVTYYMTLEEAENNTNAIRTPTAYTGVSSSQVIYVRIENERNTSCFNTTLFNLFINELPTISPAPDIRLCDDFSGDGVESFDLTQNNAVILNGLNVANHTVVYRNSVGVITSPYSNITSPETITVSVQNNLTTCTASINFDLIVSPKTVASFVIEECDSDGDGITSFILAGANAQIINGQTGIEVTYHDSQRDALDGLNMLDTAAYYNTSNPQTIYYRVEFVSSGCFSIGDLIIDPIAAPVAVLSMPLEACDDGFGSATVDLDLANAGVTNGQVDTTVVYYLNQIDADNQMNGITGDFTYSSNTTLIARVDDDNTVCFSFTTLDILFNLLPAPFLLDQYILCLDDSDNLLNGPIELDTGLNDLDFSFEWILDGDMIVASSASISAVEGGEYTVRATRVSTGCVNTETTYVRESRVPDSYDIDITTDLFDKEHQVIVTADGTDQYWFRLDDGPYVNSGRFNAVFPGPHTATIAERSGCGEIVVDIFVFGYPDYFTPNADGIHDTWNLIGGELLPGTKLYIFDRYGILLKQLSSDGTGWDGTFNGQPMPSGDYWFRIEYSFDGKQREASGHFAMKR